MFGDLVVNLIARVNQFTKPMQQARGVLSSFKAATTSAVSGVMGSFGALTGIGSIVGGAMAGLSVGAAITWGASLAIEAEKAQVAFTTMLDSPEKAKELLADLSAFAVATPYGSPVVIDAARQLLAYGTQAADIVPTLGMLGDVASGVGMPLGEIAYLFGTAQVQGKLFAKDINQFTGRGIPIIQALADVIGTSKDNIMDLASQGKITSDLMEQAFAKMTGAGGRFNGGMAAQSQTIEGLWSTLKDNVELALRDISAALMAGFDIKGLFADGISFTDTFRANIETWLPIFTQIGATTRELFGWLITAGGDLYKTLAFVFGNFGALASLALSQVGLSFVTLGNDIAHFFTGTLPAALMGFVTYATNLMGTLLDNIAGKMADVKAMLTGGSATHVWKAMGDVQFQMNAAPRQETDLERSMKASNEEKANRLGEALTANDNVYKPTEAAKTKEKMGPRFATDDEFAAQNKTANDVTDKTEKKRNKVNSDHAAWLLKGEEAARKKRGDELAGEMKPGKMSGAIGARTNEAYKAIVGAMTGAKSDPQAAQTRSLNRIAKNSDEDRMDLRKIREKLVDQGDQVLERI